MNRPMIYSMTLLVMLLLGVGIIISVTKEPHSLGYTKVYFENNVFPEIEVNRTYEFAFFIESHEKTTMKYVYVVYLDNTSIRTGEIVLDPNDLRRISFNISIKNVTYSTRILKNEINTLRVDNPEGLVKAPWTYGVDLSKQTNWSGEELLYVIKNFPVIYIGEEGTSFIINTTMGSNITDISVVNEGDKKIKTIKEFNLTPTKTGYLLNLRTLQIEYSPKPVEIRVIVISSSGKKYYLTATLHTKEGINS